MKKSEQDTTLVPVFKGFRVPFFWIMAVLLPLGLAGCEKDESSSHAQHPEASAAKKAWHCPMHPHIIKDHKDACPLCGMDLVEFASGAQNSTAQATDSVHNSSRDVLIDPAVVQKIGVRTAMVEAGVVGREIRAEAEGVSDEAAEMSVTVRTMGYLETVSMVRTGDRIRAGQILAQLYSPELVAAQGDWLAARRSGDSLSAQAARQRLLTLGFPANRLQEVAQTSQPVHTIALTAPVNGWLKTRMAVRQQAVMAGAELFRIVEGSGVLVEARVSVQDAALLQVGDLATLTGAGLSRELSAKVEAVLPQVERTSRTATVRLSVPKSAQMRIGALYQAKFLAKSQTGFVIPQDAVLRTGTREVAFLDLGNGRFRPVEIKTGATSGGQTIVLEGLEAGDEVVVSAQFLLDGESRLQSALDQLMVGAEPSSESHGSHP